MKKTPIQELIQVYKERIKEYKDDARQEAIIYAVISDLENLLEKEKQMVVDLFSKGVHYSYRTEHYGMTTREVGEEIFNNKYNQNNKGDETVI